LKFVALPALHMRARTPLVKDRSKALRAKIKNLAFAACNTPTRDGQSASKGITLIPEVHHRAGRVFALLELQSRAGPLLRPLVGRWRSANALGLVKSPVHSANGGPQARAICPPSLNSGWWVKGRGHCVPCSILRSRPFHPTSDRTRLLSNQSLVVKSTSLFQLLPKCRILFRGPRRSAPGVQFIYCAQHSEVGFWREPLWTPLRRRLRKK